MRTGDTPQRERARFARHPADILITTPESLYLLLTSQAAEALRTVETVIVDEIHALVPTKRGAHLALTLGTAAGADRQAAAAHRPLGHAAAAGRGGAVSGRSGSAGNGEAGSRDRATTASKDRTSGTPAGNRDQEASRGVEALSTSAEDAARSQSGPGQPQVLRLPPLPLAVAQDDSAELGGLADSSTPLRYRPVTIVNAAAPKQLKLRIEVPVEDMARLGEMEEIPSGPASQTPRRVSIWNAIHPRLLEIIRERNSTILFVNARQTAERLAGALNDLAGEPIARAHHGSLAAAQRSVIEEQLKAGQIRALCATSTLELGIDMGAVDLVIQIESPPSVASGMQRIGRAGHHVDAVSEGVLFPKYRADLVACAAVTRAMHEGHIESTRFPRNPLDVLCQQLVAIVACRAKSREQGSKGAREQKTEIREQRTEIDRACIRSDGWKLGHRIR